IRLEHGAASAAQKCTACAAPHPGPAQVPRPQPRLQHRKSVTRPRLSTAGQLRARDSANDRVVQGPGVAAGGRALMAGGGAAFAQEESMELQGKRAAILVEQQYQEMEVWYPLYRLREAGCKVTLVGPEAGQTYPSKLGYPAKSDKAAKDVSADDFDVIV